MANGRKPSDDLNLPPTGGRSRNNAVSVVISPSSSPTNGNNAADSKDPEAPHTPNPAGHNVRFHDDVENKGQEKDSDHKETKTDSAEADNDYPLDDEFTGQS